MPAGFRKLDYPQVAYRGIFINDEDWGLTPWSWKHYEPSERKGQIGPKTHARIFELLLRLRANTFWPAMHECSIPFFFTEGNKEMADKYAIYLGTSHCEPMMRNTNGEWKMAGKGEYDYVHNRKNVLFFWEERVKQLRHSDDIYTLGMRGVHDGKMQGAKTLEEQKKALTEILADQRRMLAKYKGKDLTKVPQVLIPYKEVLDIYQAGLQVPEDVTLMWCDDNYGYITHFPTAKEAARPGGNGIYYHVSYWGRPHDYLWLSTASPYLLYQQMKQAYEKGIRQMWILNVGDIKPAEYQTELFMDMAWNIGRVQQTGVTGHLSHFCPGSSGLFQLLLCYLCCRSITGWHTSVNRSLWDIQEPKRKTRNTKSLLTFLGVREKSGSGCRFTRLSKTVRRYGAEECLRQSVLLIFIWYSIPFRELHR